MKIENIPRRRLKQTKASMIKMAFTFSKMATFLTLTDSISTKMAKIREEVFTTQRQDITKPPEILPTQS